MVSNLLLTQQRLSDKIHELYEVVRRSDDMNIDRVLAEFDAIISRAQKGILREMNGVDNSVKIGVNIFILRDGKILMGHRIGKVGAGTWCLPGGHFEFGENLLEAAMRELKEEAGLTATELEFAQLINDPNPRKNTHYVHINFIARKWGGEPKVTEPEKFAEWRWFDLLQLPEEIFEGHKLFIPAFLKKVNFIA